MSKRQKFPMRVIKGGFAPASETAKAELRERGYKIGDLLFADFSKPRNPGFHRLAHALGRLLTENLDSFDGMAAHKALKRVQWEANVGCEEMSAQVDGAGTVVIRIPQSLSYESMDQGRFHEVYMGMCRWVAKKYWTELDGDAVAEMAEVMVNE